MILQMYKYYMHFKCAIIFCKIMYSPQNNYVLWRKI